MSARRPRRVVIAGAGLAGRLLAWHVARHGHEVDVFDSAPGAEAPLAAAFSSAGLLSPLAESEHAGAEIAALGWRSLELWPRIVEALAERVRPAGLFRREGSLLLAHPRDDASMARALARIAAHAQAGRPGPRPLAPAELEAMEPALVHGLRGWHLPGEGQVDAQRLMLALCDDASGVRWHWSSAVEAVRPGRLLLADGSARGRAVDADIAFDTRGLGARPELPLRGVRGEIFWLHAPGAALRRPVRLLHPHHRVYLVPRRDDVVIVGATEIDCEDRSPVSVRSTLELLGAAQSIVPQLAEARIVSSRTHLRPALPDHRPLLQCDDGVVRLNGLFRHGWLVAPALVEQALRACKLGELHEPQSPSCREMQDA